MSNFHPRYMPGDGDLIIISSDKIKFNVHSADLKQASGFFQEILDDAHNDNLEPLELEEDSNTLSLLFDMIYPVYDATKYVESCDEAWAVSVAADRYKILDALPTIRVIISSNDAFEDEPIKLYVVACRWNWEDIIKRAAGHAVFSNMGGDFDDHYLKYLSAENLLNLTRFRRRCIRRFISELKKITMWKSLVDAFNTQREDGYCWSCICGTATTKISLREMYHATASLLLAIRGAFDIRPINTILEEESLWEHAGAALWALRCNKCHVKITDMKVMMKKMQNALVSLRESCHNDSFWRFSQSEFQEKMSPKDLEY